MRNKNKIQVRELTEKMYDRNGDIKPEYLIYIDENSAILGRELKYRRTHNIAGERIK